MYDETITEIERQRRRDLERKKQEEREEEYRKATKSATFGIFNSTIGTITVVFTAAVCLYFLWTNSKPIFVIVVTMLILSYVFRRVSKYYFIKGDRKNFERFNKLAGVMGVSATLVELADYNKNRTRGAFNKMEDVEDSTKSTIRMIRDTVTTGGIYVDPKYDHYRERCVSVGKHVYLSGDPNRVYKILVESKNYEKSHNSLPKDCSVCIGTLYMLVDDTLNNLYTDGDMDLFYGAIGALHFFAHPLSNIPDSIPIAGFTDNMLMPLCITAGYLDSLNEYKDWKIRETKENELSRVENGLLDTVKARGKSLRLNISILQRTLRTLANGEIDSKYENISYETREHIKQMYNMVKDALTNKYGDLSEESMEYCVGALWYLVNEDDMVKDSTPITGLIDDEVVIKAVYNKCRRDIDKYLKWTLTNTLSNKLDPLVDYLDSVIGADANERRKEVNRLAAMCTDTSLTNVSDKARSVVIELF